MLTKKQRNKCGSLRRQCKKQHLTKITENGITTNKEFWNFIKTFLTNKGFSKIMTSLSRTKNKS